MIMILRRVLQRSRFLEFHFVTIFTISFNLKTELQLCVGLILLKICTIFLNVLSDRTRISVSIPHYPFGLDYCYIWLRLQLHPRIFHIFQLLCVMLFYSGMTKLKNQIQTWPCFIFWVCIVKGNPSNQVLLKPSSYM